jgi:predicted component of type VI protein secretion system
MTVILATKEAEIRRTVVLNPKPRQIVRDPISKILNTKQGWQSGSIARVTAQQA